MPHWQRNLVVLCAAQFLTLLGFSAYIPFIPYYFQELGVPSMEATRSWCAVFDSGAALTMMLVSPIWGSLADRHGRKLMLVRATLAGALIAALMALVRTPTQLVALRIIQGSLTGTVAAAMTLISTETPEGHLGVSLGIMQTAQFGGQALGPVVGGLVADAVGYRAVFPCSAAMMAVSLVAIVALVRERNARPKAERGAPREPLVRQLRTGLSSSNTVVLVIALGSTSFALAVLSPIVSLYVQQLAGETERLATLAGAIVSAAAVSSSISALVIGRLADRVGHKPVLLLCMVGIALSFVPQALVTNTTQLLVARVFQGLFLGGVLPTANALLARSASATQRGTVFGLAASAQAGGRTAGPLMGAFLANSWGPASAFFVTAGIFGLISALVSVFVRPAAEATAPEQRSVPAA